MADSVKVVAKNSKAYHDYFIEDKYEAGIELAGTEVKSIRLGHVNLKDSFCVVKDGEMSVIGMHISPYEKGNIFNKDPMRQRRLLMHKREILRLFARIKQDGYTLMGKLSNLLMKKQPDFDPRNYGFSKLSKMIKSLDRFEVDVRQVGDNNTDIYVRDKQGKDK